jgi:hypothetical protein
VGEKINPVDSETEMGLGFETEMELGAVVEIVRMQLGILETRQIELERKIEDAKFAVRRIDDAQAK